MKRDSGSQASLRREHPENGETSCFEAVLESGQGIEALDGDQTISAPRRRSSDPGPEANLILIALRASRPLGPRFGLKPHSTIRIGRAPWAQISLPEVTTLSGKHARF